MMAKIEMADGIGRGQHAIFLVQQLSERMTRTDRRFRKATIVCSAMSLI
jgi:hypothetical protein